MTEPQTEAGKALLEALEDENCKRNEVDTCHAADAVRAEEWVPRIEAEARSQLLADLRAQVEGLNRPPTREEELAECERLGCEDVNHPIQYAERMVKQAAVLSLLETPR